MLLGRIVADSQIIREHGFEELLDKFGAEPRKPNRQLYTGVYMAVSGDIPVIDGGCGLKVGANGELQIWYFSGNPDVYGGQLKGSVYGEIGCVMSARGTLFLSAEQLAEDGESSGGRTCPDDGNPDNIRSCAAFSGGFSFAMGAGFDCDRGTWRAWEDRWWGDSRCYQWGANVTMDYISPAPAGEDTWDYDAEWDFE